MLQDAGHCHGLAELLRGVVVAVLAVRPSGRRERQGAGDSQRHDPPHCVSPSHRGRVLVRGAIGAPSRNRGFASSRRSRASLRLHDGDGEAARGRGPRVELLPARGVHVGARPVVEAHRRDPRAGPHRRGARRGRRARPRADGARARDGRAVRALLPRHRHRGRARGRHLGDPRRLQPRRVPAPRRARRAGADHRGGGVLRLPRGGQLDDADRRRGARPRRRLDAAHPRRGPQGAGHVLVAARRRAHDRALPRPRAGQAQAPEGAARAHREVARGCAVARRRRRAGRHRRHGPQPRRGGRDGRGAALVRRPGLPAAQGGARRPGRHAGRPHPRRARRRARHQARARRPDPGRRRRRAVRDGGRRLRRAWR